MLAHTAHLWREIAGARLFITGGSGFWGAWLLEAVAGANDALGVAVTASILSRQPARVAATIPRLFARSEFDWLTGDSAAFAFPEGRHDYVFHFATPSARELGAGDAALAMRTLAGTQRVLKFARHCGARRLLLASSGAVYGHLPEDVCDLVEDCRYAPNPVVVASAYGETKRMSELLCTLTPQLECVIARGFAFVGPHLPLTDKFAVGSFLSDALAGGPIRVRSDGRPVRGYLYAADLVIWLLTILLRGRANRPYNVGSDEAVSLAELASEVAKAAGGVALQIALPPGSGPAGSYLPDLGRARGELGLRVWISRQDAISRTLAWARQLRAFSI